MLALPAAAGLAELTAPAAPAARAGAAAEVPLRTFRGSSTSGATSYPYTMVRTAPTGPAITTTAAITLSPFS